MSIIWDSVCDQCENIDFCPFFGLCTEIDRLHSSLMSSSSRILWYLVNYASISAISAWHLNLNERKLGGTSALCISSCEPRNRRNSIQRHSACDYESSYLDPRVEILCHALGVGRYTSFSAWDMTRRHTGWESHCLFKMENMTSCELIFFWIQHLYTATSNLGEVFWWRSSISYDSGDATVCFSNVDDCSSNIRAWSRKENSYT